MVICTFKNEKKKEKKTGMNEFAPTLFKNHRKITVHKSN